MSIVSTSKFSLSLFPNFAFGNSIKSPVNKSAVPEITRRFIRWERKRIGYEEVEEETEESIIKRKQNCSHLKQHDYRRAHGIPPQLDEHDRNLMPLWQYRKLYGRFGMASGVDLKCLWPSKKELFLAKEREKLEFPYSVNEMIDMAIQEKEDEYNQMMKRQEDIVKNMKDLEKWKENVRNRIEKQEQAARVHKDKKQKQIEEVRKIFGYHIDPKDQKFTAALEKKEEEDRKRLKKEKKLLRQQRELERLQAFAMQESEETKSEVSPDENLGKPLFKGIDIPNPDDGDKEKQS